jgi:hypothetical protein
MLAHEAISSLINIASSEAVATIMGSHEEFMARLCRNIVVNVLLFSVAVDRK